jgi:hypothetical protein
MTGLAFLENLGAHIEYPEKHGFIIAAFNGHTLRMKPGSKTAVVDGKNIQLQAAPSVKHYPAQIPTASVVRALGGRAQYSQKGFRLHVWLKAKQ